MNNDMLIATVEKLAAIHEMRQIMHQYCEYCDDNYNAEGIASLFTEDADWEAVGFGKFKGREAIAGYFRSVRDSVDFAQHLVVNDRVTVDGDRGRGKFCLIMPCTFIEDGEKVDRWVFSEYINDYRRIDGKWYIENLLSDLKMIARYDQGFSGAGLLDMTGLAREQGDA